MKPLDYKHYFKVVNGKFIFEDREMFDFVKHNLEGERGYAIIKPVEQDISPNQFAYYFGGIIRKECMSSNAFAGWKEGEIHNHLLKEVDGNTKPVKGKDGIIRYIETVPDFSLYGKKKMAEYISKLIPHLQMEYDIHPKPSDHYKYNKFQLKTQIFSNEDME